MDDVDPKHINRVKEILTGMSPEAFDIYEAVTEYIMSSYPDGQKPAMEALKAMVNIMEVAAMANEDRQGLQ